MPLRAFPPFSGANSIATWMKVFLYEYITGGGLLGSGESAPPSGSLLREGAAMLSAIARDLYQIPDVEVSTLRDARLATHAPSGVAEGVVRNADEQAEQFEYLAAEAEWTVVIAPEFGGALLDRVRRVEQVGGRLLGPGPSLVELGTSKEATLKHFAASGIRTPHGCRLAADRPLPKSLRFPAVLKPPDGAGSQGIRFAATLDSLPPTCSDAMWLEEFRPGTPASVAILAGDGRKIVLPACRQLLTDDGKFSYRGGRLPLDEPLGRRAEVLARSVADALPPFVGYLGIDMVLGPAQELDCLIELNPRLTTSYVGLRHATQQNLAATMLELAEGRSPDLCFDGEPVEFSADGRILSAQIGEKQAV